ncbi:hypothetical protein OSTOST_03640 [Ostertagia ostertagi]
MVSIIPLQVLANAYHKGYNIETLEREDDSQMETVYDASNHPMTFLGIVRIHVKLHGGPSSDIAFHISDEKSEEILLGTNALKKLGIKIIINPPSKEEQEVTTKDVPPSAILAADRVAVPALCVRLVTALCDVPGDTTEGVIWATKQGINSGIYKVRNKKITIPIQNREHEPFVIKKGEKLGEWGTEKWLTKWEDCTMLDQESFKISIDEKQKLLQEQIQQNRKENSIEEDLTSLLISYADVFAVCEKELSQTDLVRMSIDTGDSQPVKLKTRPVPLGLRKRLKEMLQDLEDRKIIEKSNSDWAFPIVLVEKKDGSIRLCVDYPCAQHFEEGGRVISAWTPCSHENVQSWKKMYEVWSALDETLKKGAGKGQFCATATTKIINGKVYAEFGSPETCWQFFGKYAGVANARYLYENIRMIACSVMMPPMHGPPRTSATRRGGMFRKDGLTEGPPSKRASH